MEFYIKFKNLNQIKYIHLLAYLLKRMEATSFAQTHQIFKDRLL